jgi:sugar/nucleoside kinase (ribokinase family)
VPVFFEPTSVPKATAAAEEGVMSYVTFTSPNEAELAAMAAAVRRRRGAADRERERETDTGREELISIQEHLLKEAEELHSEARGAEGDREEVRAEGEGMSAGRGQKLERIRRDITVLLDVGVEVVLVTAGSEGIYYGTIDIETGAPAVVHFPANVVPPHAIANTTGAGDSFAGGFVCAASRQWPLDQAVALGQAAASLALYSHAPVSAELCMEALAQPVLLSMRPPPALKPRGETHVFTQGDKAGVERESDRRPF